MSRLPDALQGEDSPFAEGYQNPMLDLQFGGQMGFAPDLTQWVSNQQYIRKPLFALLLAAPTGFQQLNRGDVWVRTLRSMVELQPLSITGLNNGLTVEFAETPVGGAGEMQEDPTDVKRTRSQAVFRWNEKYGMSVQRFFDAWIRYLIMDPNTKYAMINTLGNAGVTDMLADRYTATMAFIEPDPTHTRVVKAWIGTNMMPKQSGESIGARDITTASDKVDYDIEFTGIYQSGAGVTQFCQELLDGINITGSNPHLRQSFIDRISADVLASRQSYANGITDLANQNVLA